MRHVDAGAKLPTIQLMRAPKLLVASSGSLFALVLLALAAPGCSENPGASGGGAPEPPPDGRCYEDPLSCEDGTVCAFDDEDGVSMTCLPAGKGAKGAACKNVAKAPECGEGLVCLQLKGADEGTCTPFCDAAEDCSGGLECANITTDGGKKFFACAKL